LCTFEEMKIMLLLCNKLWLLLLCGPASCVYTALLSVFAHARLSLYFVVFLCDFISVNIFGMLLVTIFFYVFFSFKFVVMG